MLYYCVPLLKNNITMLCKYYIKLGSSTIGDTADECLEVSDCIKNLDSLKVSYTRNGLGGVVRKCGSDIEFTGKAYDAIVGYYGESYLQSEGVFAVFIADNNWRYTKLWDCPLDFATLQYDGYIATIGCVDNGVAAIIKAKGKSEYEMAVSELAEPTKLLYNGVVTKRSFTFNVVGASPQGESTTDMVQSKTIRFGSKGYHTVWVPSIGTSSKDYSSEKFTIFDQNEDSAWDNTTYGKNDGLLLNRMAEVGRAGFIKCVVDGTIHIDMDLTFTSSIASYMTGQAKSHQCCFILTVGTNVVYRKVITDYSHIEVSIHGDYYMTAGQIMAFGMSILWSWGNWYGMRAPDGSTFNTTHPDVNTGLRWPSNTQTAYVNENSYDDNPTELQVIKPITLLQKLLDNMFVDWNSGYVIGEIANTDIVLNNTLMCAAESIRSIATNNVYSSFNDFVEFMESVFGFIYTIEYKGYLMERELEMVRNEETETIKHINVELLCNEQIVLQQSSFYKMYPCGGIIEEDLGEKIDFTNEKTDYGVVDTYGKNILFDEVHSVFLLYVETEDKYYSNWSTVSTLYNSHIYNRNNRSREMLGVNFNALNTKDSLFGVVYKGKLICCDSLHDYFWLDKKENKELVTLVRFSHRSSVFSDDIIKHIDCCNNIQYVVDESKVHSAISVGYAKKDYQNENSAKNEFNFTNYYNTDTTLTDNSLSLICPYRSDCYGIEELLKKTTDSESTSSDNDLFIIVSKKNADGTYSIDRDTPVQNAYTDTVFNAALAPNIILRKNEAYIGSFAKVLKFTSSDGNSSAIIGGIPMKSNINIGSQMFKAGTISIDTGDVALPETWNGLIVFEYNGKTYRGYLESVDINFANTGTLTYNLIEKCIE